MKNWLQKLISMFKENEESIVESDKEEQIKELQPMTFTNKKENTKARVTFHYPKGQFRFPVIPDPLNNKDENNRPKRKETNHRTRTVSPKKSNTKKDSIPMQEFKEKRPFKPTIVPSPIYGFSSNDSVKEKEIHPESNEKVRTEKGYNLIRISPETPKDTEIEENPDLKVNDLSTEMNDVEHEDKNEDDKVRQFVDIAMEQKEEDEVLSYVEGTNEEQQTEEEYNHDLADGQSMDSVLLSEVAVTVESEIEELEVKEDNSDQTQLINNDSIEDNFDSKEEEVSPILLEKEKNKPVELKKKEPRKEIRPGNGDIPFNVLMSNNDKKKNEEHKPKVEKKEKSIKPPLHLLDIAYKTQDDDHEWLEEQKKILNETLENFNVKAKVVNAAKGPSVTRFEVQPEPGVKVNKITNLSDDLKLSLAAKDIRMEAPIPGKNAIGIEVPNPKSEPVFLTEIICHREFSKSESPLTVALGLDIGGKPIVTDIKKMPHGLIAGATGSGKSVCINSIIVSLLYKADPHQVKLMLIDPKMVELAPYNHIPHLVSPVITDVKAATAALKWAVDEMERRYELFAHSGVRDIERYNYKANQDEQTPSLPYLVIIIDELADLMMVSPQEVEESICRIAQKARACGIHLLLATQRPSVDVITGLIKANIPTRIAFSVSSQVDSRTIIDINGAEKLLGKGDMLFLANGSSKPMRIQGNFVSDDAIDKITNHVRSKMKPNYLFEQEELIQNSYVSDQEDELFDEATEFIFDQDGASASSLQRRFHIGYNRAARLIDMMESQGIISEAKGSKPRDILISREAYENMRTKY